MFRTHLSVGFRISLSLKAACALGVKMSQKKYQILVGLARSLSTNDQNTPGFLVHTTQHIYNMRANAKTISELYTGPDILVVGCKCL